MVLRTACLHVLALKNCNSLSPVQLFYMLSRSFHYFHFFQHIKKVDNFELALCNERFLKNHYFQNLFVKKGSMSQLFPLFVTSPFFSIFTVTAVR